MKLAVAALAFLIAAGTAFAHHSPIVFDRTKQVTLTGVVTEFRWGNPHSWIHIDIADADGRTARSPTGASRWTLRATSRAKVGDRRR
jgi:hypothetical protein